ncbi:MULTISPECIES: ABC transporter ATP-binding protein [unclassified Oceanispirochaeta]|uniref:ABC transporter ATP-binding protein n=1 Tax=unclassified Oceanispirochaeta TaxID=2635722 RepID=UPI000E09095A|nr:MULTISPECIES: ABC transporter ATP-binding protein [unclassified Oceanispirochaeta]MBF9015005.1 ABC transporter ATP-binding protein [Oceanispirochaeta sp. M2]NPD71314.1 ABC transporter ATP-binding protein [Oceanispirochaeta sp. M1]RDG33280.1 ABC transporter ATP-binding protein [Oceanispirochaeta sp. M1]
MNTIMHIDNLKKNYGTVQAVDGISFDIEEGICFGLLGPNGAGKTTTIEMMEGILSPSSGTVYFRDKIIDQNFKKKVGIQFQNTALPEFITVKETLELFRSLYPDPRTMDEVIEICSLSDIIDRDNRKLSGGQRQRMLLGLAIIPRPEMVFLDEPTTGLDPQARRNFWDLIKRIKAEKTTVLLTTHYMEEAEILCDKIAIMDHGKLMEIDTPEQLLLNHFDGALVSVPHSGRTDLDLEGGLLKGDLLEITTQNLDKTMRELLASQLNLEGLSIKKPNLEDLFLKLTGTLLRS